MVNSKANPTGRMLRATKNRESSISSPSPQKGSVRPKLISPSPRARKQKKQPARRSSSSSYSPPYSSSSRRNIGDNGFTGNAPPTNDRQSRSLKRTRKIPLRYQLSPTPSESSSLSSSSSSSSASSVESDYSPPENKTPKRGRGRPPKKMVKQAHKSPSASTVGKKARPKPRKEAQSLDVNQPIPFTRKNCPAHIKEILQATFKKTHHPSTEEREELIKLTKLSQKDITKWFKKERDMEKMRTMSREDREKFYAKRRIYRWKRRPGNQNKEGPELFRESQRFPQQRTLRLEQVFEMTEHPTATQKKELAKELGMTAKKVGTWFWRQRRREGRKNGTWIEDRSTLPAGLPLEEATPILESFFADHPERSKENFIELNAKTGWSLSRLEAWYRIRRREESNHGKKVPKKSNGKKRNKEFYFTEEVYKALNDLFETKQFLEKKSKDLDGLVPLESTQTWFYRKRMELLDAWMNGTLKELPCQMAKMEEYYSISCFIEDDNLKKLEKQVNLTSLQVLGYFETRRNVDRKAGKDIPTEEQKKEKQRELNKDNNADSSLRRHDRREVKEEEQESEDEDSDDEDQEVEMDSDLDSDDDDISEDDDYDEEDEFSDDENEEEEKVTDPIQRSSQHDRHEVNIDVDFHHDEREIKKEQVTDDQMEFDAPEFEDSFFETSQFRRQRVSRKIRQQECPKEMQDEDDKLVEQLSQAFESGDPNLNYKAVPKNNQNVQPVLNWRFDYVCLPHNKNINYTEWTNEDFIEFGAQFLSKRSLEILKTKEVNGSHAKHFVSPNPQFFRVLNDEEFESHRPPSFTWEEFRMVRQHLSILFSLVDPVEE